MSGNIVDRDLLEAERAASPQRYQRRDSAEIERVISASTVSSSSSENSARRRSRSIGQHNSISRISTQNDLEHHPTELSRIVSNRPQPAQCHRRRQPALAHCFARIQEASPQLWSWKALSPSLA
ncbi:hypothetical protein NXS19_007750 [Fusarium pseudograminearum]|nr:hypothetical protein NXS19_007750 [Fusarium pseudograminearum]